MSTKSKNASIVSKPSGLTYPNRFAKAYFIAMDEVMGRHGLATLLGYANLEQYLDNPPDDSLAHGFDFRDLSALSQALEEMYGARGGRGMALRIGRAAFAMSLKNFGIMRGLGDSAFQSLPLTQRVDFGLKALASLFNNFSDQQCTVDTSSAAYLFHITNSPMAWGRVADKPVCHAQVGVIQETLRWATNGYEFHVMETACAATGHDHCTFRINKTAIGEW
ncbi:4-vinyl reductase [Phototrophicus methaneseepsis]|uniref:4-vinyl reductase n=1 Tax=Phototrophicus methaneseepsis TaxID=2710758 RepID=A0A7S8E9S2_9CHLR|nr:4-vinyl reductase [Phototrophicus methaneseepsis]QPC82987.1 4-vinyl reductase [Phototrophicus methaneseepsis]